MTTESTGGTPEEFRETPAENAESVPASPVDDSVACANRGGAGDAEAGEAFLREWVPGKSMVLRQVLDAGAEVALVDLKSPGVRALLEDPEARELLEALLRAGRKNTDFRHGTYTPAVTSAVSTAAWDRLIGLRLDGSPVFWLYDEAAEYAGRAVSDLMDTAATMELKARYAELLGKGRGLIASQGHGQGKAGLPPVSDEGGAGEVDGDGE